MSNKIIFNLYEENIANESKTLRYSTLLLTELTATAVVEHLNVHDGFSVHVIEGVVLSFVDFSCIQVSPNYVISALANITTTNTPPQINLPNKCILCFDSEINGDVLSRHPNELVYTCDRFECGASGFAEAITHWVESHPIEMIFIGGLIWDKTKDFYHFLRNKLFKTSSTNNTPAPIVFSPKKFHKKLAAYMNIDSFSFQITDISRLKRGQHIIIIRTIKNDEYTVTAKVNGDIISMKRNKK